VCTWLIERGIEVHGVFRVAQWFEEEQIDSSAVDALARRGLRIEVVRERPGRRRALGIALLEDVHQLEASAAAVAEHATEVDATLSLDLGWALALDRATTPAVALLGDPLRGRLRVPVGAPWSRPDLDRRARRLSLARTTKPLAAQLRGYDGDRRVLGSLSPAEAAELTREGLPVRHFRWFTPDPRPTPAWTPQRDPLRLLHVGALATTATRAMFREWERAVLPAIAALPFEVEIHLVGRGSVPPFRSSPANLRVVARGHLEDLAEEYALAAAFLSPMRYPVGVRTRIVTALSYGVPVIADPTAAGGLPELTGGTDVLWAAKESDYADALRLVRDDVDRAGTIAAGGRAAWERWYDPATNIPALVAPLGLA
jgi:glycosyltransferase involved in cell wall biosynthesis